MELRKRLECYNLDGILLEAFHPDTGESNIERLIRQNRVDGFLIFHDRIKEEDYLLMGRWDYPVVQIHLRPQHYSIDSLDYFFTDNEIGGEKAAAHLFSRGCRRFFNLSSSCAEHVEKNETNSGCTGFSEAEDRTKGFHRSLINEGVSDESIKDMTLDGSFLAAWRLIHEKKEHWTAGDGLFFHSDLMALGALSACLEMKIDVPGILKFIGFDDSPIGTLMAREITTIHQPGEVIAEKAARRMNELLQEKYLDRVVQNEEKRSVIQEYLIPDLVIRQTT